MLLIFLSFKILAVRENIFYCVNISAKKCFFLTFLKIERTMPKQHVQQEPVAWNLKEILKTEFYIS